jgi:thioesterase domain-containing protein
MDKMDECFPVTPNQRQLWIVAHLQPHSAPYHVPVGLRLSGPLSLETLDRSIAAIVDRHESLRTIFGIRKDALVQFVRPSRPISLQVRDISEALDPGLERQAYSLARQEIDAPFDVGEGPLFRAALLRLAPDQHILICTMHHIVSDGWSAELFVRELAEYYDAFAVGRQPSLKPLAMAYSDFAVLQHRLIANRSVERQLSFWRQTLAGAPLLHSLPSDRPRPEQPTFAGANLNLRFDEKLVADLQQFSRRQRVTFFMLLAATFQLLLSKYSGQTDIVIGVPVSGRIVPETESLIGCFVNPIVLRTSFSGDPPFSEILNRVRHTLLDAMSNQDVPFEQIVNAVGAHRRLDHNPLFQIMFSTFRAAVQSREFGRLIATPYVVESSTSRFDLSVNIIEAIDNGWWLQAEYSTELFDRARIENMLEDYTMLLRSALADSYVRPSTLRLTHEEVLTGHAPKQWQATAPKVTAASGADGAGTSGFDRITEEATPTDIERRLLEIWRKHLLISSLNIDDDFFDLGGNSLLAITVMTHVNRTFDKTLPLSTLFREGTIRRLAARVRGHRALKTSFFPLLEGGTKTPLFIAGHWYQLYRQMGHALGSDQPIYVLDCYALQEERLIAQEPLFESIEDIATYFIQQISSIQRTGPYFLAGQCEGGIVALEIARQLKQQGHEIAALMQLDTAVTGYFRRVSWHRRLSVAIQRGDFLGRLLHHLTWRVRIGLTQTATEKYIWTSVWNAVCAYGTAKVFDGEIILFRAKEVTGTREDVAIGWDQVGEIKVVNVPGDHGSMFADPAAQGIIGRVLEETRQRARASGQEVDPRARRKATQR